jgi:hypothetical protein
LLQIARCVRLIAPAMFCAAISWLDGHASIGARGGRDAAKRFSMIAIRKKSPGFVYLAATLLDE